MQVQALERVQIIGVSTVFLAVFLLTASVAFAETPVQPVFDAKNFSNPTDIDNPWFSLPVGTELEYEGETADGFEEIEIEISGETKKIMGITTLIYRDIVHIDGELVEDTRDYVAQDDDGNVWYFGEDVDNYENGKFADHDGSWIAGKQGAKAGYWMPANPKVGDAYKQEYFKGEAEDQAEVVSVTATVKNGLATYTNCLKTKDTTPLEPDVLEYKYYCKQVANMVREEKPENNEVIELVEVGMEGEDEDDEVEDEDGAEDDDEDENEDDDDEVVSGNGNEAKIRALQAEISRLLQRLLALLRAN